MVVFQGLFHFLEDYFSYDGGFLYYDYPGMTDQNTAVLMVQEMLTFLNIMGL